MTTFDDTETVKRRASRLALLLADTDAPPRKMVFPDTQVRTALAHRRAMRWRIAAAIAVLLVGAGVPPVRAWIVGTVHTAWLKVTGHPVPAPAPAPSAPVPVVTMGSVSFPAMDPVTIRLATRQSAGGTLTVETGPAGIISAAITGEANGAELRVLPDGLRIANTRASTAGYVIRVPADLSRVMVVIGEERPRVFVAPGAGDRFVVDLAVRTGGRGTFK